MLGVAILVGMRGRSSGAPLSPELGLLREALRPLELQARDDSARSRRELTTQLAEARRESAQAISQLSDSLLARMAEQAAQQTLASEHTGRRLEDLREAVDQKLKEIQSDNGARLEQIRATVEEKLEATLERRLGESFQLVSERLEAVAAGLGEMRTLAAGVGDLKKVLTNVKARGMWGEIQLESLLEQFLTPDQYAKNVATRPDASERVEFAIRLPGREDGPGGGVQLPIDAKFPMEDYERLVDARERSDADAADAAGRALEKRILAEAAKISEKYLEPPHTTDFALMFLPTESLYAEVLARPGLFQRAQTEHRVVVSGPSTLAALLNALQMGFRTLAIERHSSEVWDVLHGVKREFGRFGEALAKVRRKIREAGDQIDNAQRRSQKMERELRAVEDPGAAGRLPADSESESTED